VWKYLNKTDLSWDEAAAAAEDRVL